MVVEADQCPHPPVPQPRPGPQVGKHLITTVNRPAAPGHQQIEHRHQVDLVGLDSPLAEHLALLGHMSGVELDQVPGLRQEP